MYFMEVNFEPAPFFLASPLQSQMLIIFGENYYKLLAYEEHKFKQQIVRYFGFSKYIIFISRYIIKLINLEKFKTSYIFGIEGV